MIFGNDKILLERLASEVEYLRDQNQKLTDRLLAIFDSKNYIHIKQIEANETAQKTQLKRVERMNPEDFKQEIKIASEEAAKAKVLNMQLSQMMGAAES